MQRTITVLLFVLLNAFGAQAQTPTAEQVDKIFEKWNKPNSPGCALSVMKDGSIIYKHGYGMADLDHDVPITPSTIFHVASVSKQFTAASIVLLAQQGKLSLDDQVRKYVTELPDFGKPITIRHLLHHVSGLRDQWALLGLAGWRYSLDLITDDDVLSVISRQKDLNFPPGERYLYCNTGFTLLAQTVKRVTGKSLREFTTANIFEPLGMKNTHFRDDHAEIVKNIAYGYVPSKDTFRLSVTNFDTVGATSLLTTAEDLALWDENFYNPRVGGKALIEQMLQRGVLNSGEQIDYAFGLQHGKYKGLAIVEHSGSDAGYRAHLIRFPEKHFSVACLCNTSNNPGNLARQVADIYLAKEITPEVPKAKEPVVTLSEAQLSGRAGVYVGQDDVTRRIALKDGTLRRMQREEGIELQPLSETRFRPASGPQVEVRFEIAGGRTRLIEVPEGGGKPSVYEKGDEFKPSPAQLKEYAGVYLSDEIEPPYRIVVENDKLLLDRLKSKAAPLEPATRDLFTSTEGSIRFTRDAHGKITGFVLNAGRVLNFRFRRNTADTVTR